MATATKQKRHVPPSTITCVFEDWHVTISYQPLSVTIVRPSRVVQLLRICDFECFLSFLHGLIEMLATQPTYVVRDDGREEDHSFLALFL